MGTVSLKWIESELMLGADSYGHPVVIGSSPPRQPEWAALKPSDLLLLSAASCAMYDVAGILTKQREPLLGLEAECTGEQLPDPPFTFTSVRLHFRLRGALNPDKVSRAIYLAEHKYCSVISTLRPTVAIHCDYEILPA
jgi:putative redox protein